jgi:hypothetical protein
MLLKKKANKTDSIPFQGSSFSLSTGYLGNPLLLGFSNKGWPFLDKAALLSLKVERPFIRV